MFYIFLFSFLSKKKEKKTNMLGAKRKGNLKGEEKQNKTNKHI